LAQPKEGGSAAKEGGNELPHSKGSKTMTITIQLTPDQEAQLRESAARGDADAVRALLVDAVAPTVDALLSVQPTPLTDEEFKALIDEGIAIVAAGSSQRSLSDWAVSRESLYEGHL
jgi:hypothetical protein